MKLQSLLLVAAFTPLVGAILAGLFGTQFMGARLGRVASHRITILGVLISFIASCLVAQQAFEAKEAIFNQALYTWAVADGIKFDVGFLIDRLTVTMMLVVTFVSLMVHIYTIKDTKVTTSIIVTVRRSIRKPTSNLMPSATAQV